MFECVCVFGKLLYLRTRARVCGAVCGPDTGLRRRPGPLTIMKTNIFVIESAAGGRRALFSFLIFQAAGVSAQRAAMYATQRETRSNQNQT